MADGSWLLSGIATGTIFVAGIVALLVFFDVHEELVRFLLWLESQGTAGLLLFALIMALVVLFLLPGALFTTGAGFVFGVVAGTIAVVLGTTLGAVLAFLAARYVVGARAARYLSTHSKLRVVSEDLTRSGWKAALLIRLVPFFPSKLANYFFGLTQISLRDFAGGTLVGIIPLSLHNVYLGSIAADITAAGTFGAERGPIAWALYAGGFIATLAAVLYFGRLAQRALASHEHQEAA